jgi:exosome complex component CSL4
MGSQSSTQKSGQLVIPGERLGVIEEFVPDNGTYVKDGVIYSKIVGHALVDLATRRVSVYSAGHEAILPKVGSIVVGQVQSSQNDNAMVRIFKVGDTRLSGVFSGVLHISDVSMRFVDSMFDVCKPSDILRAKVLSDKNRTYHLTTKDRDLGVVFAFCSNCGFSLEHGRQGMICPRCGHIERRKTAADYGKGDI